MASAPSYPAGPVSTQAFQPVAAAQGVQFNPTINVSVAQTAPAPSTVVIVGDQHGTNIVVRALWFLCIGLWLGGIWMFIAWVLNVSIIGLPLGLMMINRVPQVMTLKKSSLHTSVTVVGNTTVVTTGVGAQQRSFLLRAIYFVLVGWWASGIWMALSWAAAALIITLPVAF